MVRPDSRFIAAALDYIGVRITNIDDVDANLFPFDYDLTLAVVLANADGTVYHRYGGRSDTSPMNMNSLIEIMKEGLKTHQAYVSNPSPPPARERLRIGELVSTELKGTMKPVYGCYHCHYVREANQSRAVKERRWKPNQFWIWPSTKRFGLVMDQQRQYLISAVLDESPAALAGLQRGDLVQTLDGKRILTKYDVQWILDQAAWDKRSMAFTVLRGGQLLTGAMPLEKAWKVGDPRDYAWRVSNVYTEHMNKFLPTPGFAGETPGLEERYAAGLSDGAFALKVTHLNYGTYLAGIRLGDIILGAGDEFRFHSQRAFFHACEVMRQAHEDIRITLLRRGVRMQVMVNLNYLNYLEVESPPEVILGFIAQERAGDRGLRVGSVQDGSSAERAGLVHGDQIRSIDNEPLRAFNALQELLADKAPGDMLTIVVGREGKTMEFAYVLADKQQQLTDLVELSDVVEENGQILTCTVNIKLPQGQHVYSVHEKGFGVPTFAQFRGGGYRLLGSLEEPQPRKVDQPGLGSMYVLEGDIQLKQRIQIPDKAKFLLLMHVYAQVCDDSHCHEFRAVVANHGSTREISEFRGRLESHSEITDDRHGPAESGGRSSASR